ncbi:MAG: amidase [Pseudomonadota bacterium]
MTEITDAPATEFDEASALEMALAIRTKKVTSEALTRSALARLRPVHDACNAVIAFEDDEALAGAEAADKAVAQGGDLGPLHGVPLAHKDMFGRAGKRATWGANIHPDTPAEADATVIARLKAAGALQIAALHMTEFAFGPTGHNYIIGHARNPHDRALITGGSSSGSAISVATGVIPTAFGSDTGGSLRLPAAACGIKSLKPTWSRVSLAGAMPLSGLHDCIGPLARHADDLALVMSLIAGPDPRDGRAADVPVPDFLGALEKSPAGFKIGIDDAVNGQSQAGVLARLESARGVLRDMGCSEHAVTFPDWPTLEALGQLLLLPDVAAGHAAFMRNRADDYGPQVRARIEVGHFISAVDHNTALRARGFMLQKVLDETFGACDAILLPVFPDPVPTIAELDVADSQSLLPALARITLYTRAINYLGLPSVTLPYARAGDDKPNGFQLVGRPFREDQLITFAKAYEAAVPPDVARV